MVIKKASLVDIAIKRMKQHITEGEWQPGDRYLSEKELVQRLEVSRTVIREALISLQSIGLLKIVTGDGVFIANPNIDPIKEIFKHYDDVQGVKVRELAEIRKVIELGAIRLLIENKLEINIPYLEELNKAYYQSIKYNTDSRQPDRLFHQYLIKSTENDTFYYFSEIIHEYFTLTPIEILQDETTLLGSYKEHQAIIQALTEKDMVKAQNLMIHHLEPIIAFTKQMEEAERNGTNSDK